MTYGGTYRYYTKIQARYGVEFTFVDTATPTKSARAFRPNTKLLHLETPDEPDDERSATSRSSPQIAHERGAIVVVDNTFASPYLQRPLALGADIVFHSTTKFLNGHSDSVGGIAVAKSPEHVEWLSFVQNSSGAILSPMDSWLVLRGIKTLVVRMERHEQNGRAIAQFLATQPKVEEGLLPGPARPPAARAREAADARLRRDDLLRPRLVRERRRRSSRASRLCSLGESLGGVETLISHPATMTHASIPEPERSRLGVTPGLVRISVGIEDVEDLIADLAQALDGRAGARRREALGEDCSGRARGRGCAPRRAVGVSPAAPRLRADDYGATRDALVERINAVRAARPAAALADAAPHVRVAQARAARGRGRPPPRIPRSRPPEDRDAALEARATRRGSSRRSSSRRTATSTTVSRRRRTTPRSRARSSSSAELPGPRHRRRAARGDPALRVRLRASRWPDFFAEKTAELVEPRGGPRRESSRASTASASARACSRCAANPLLDETALRHAKDMLARSYYGHDSPEGTTALERSKAAGYRPRFAGENIARGQYSAEEVMDGWMGSPIHREHILGKLFTDVGAAVAIGKNKNGYQVLWVQAFGRDRSEPPAALIGLTASWLESVRSERATDRLPTTPGPSVSVSLSPPASRSRAQRASSPRVRAVPRARSPAAGAAPPPRRSPASRGRASDALDGRLQLARVSRRPRRGPRSAGAGRFGSSVQTKSGTRIRSR